MSSTQWQVNSKVINTTLSLVQNCSKNDINLEGWVSKLRTTFTCIIYNPRSHTLMGHFNTKVIRVDTRNEKHIWFQQSNNIIAF